MKVTPGTPGPGLVEFVDCTVRVPVEFSTLSLYVWLPALGAGTYATTVELIAVAVADMKDLFKTVEPSRIARPAEAGALE